MATYSFNVLVKDDSGNALEDASISIYNSDGTQLGTSADTNASGTLAAAVTLDTADNTYRLLVTKTGYTTQDRQYVAYQTDTSYFIELPAYSTTYCTVNEVTRYIYGDRFTFINSSKITDSTVAELINNNEGVIDIYAGDSWLSNTSTEEYHDVDYDQLTYDGFITINVDNAPLRTADSTWKIELWDTDNDVYIDYITDKTAGRAEDYYIDYDRGIINIKPTYYSENGLRLTYTYGESTVPESIKKLCILRTVLDLINMDIYVSEIKMGDQELQDIRKSVENQIKEIEYSYRKNKF